MNKNELKTKVKNILESKKFLAVISVVGVLFVAFIIFQAGMIAGFHKASFSRDWGENYSRNFGSPHKEGFSMMIGGGEFGDFGNLPNAHGAIGKIIKIELPRMIVLDEKDNTEKVVLLNENTDIKKMRDSVTEDDLKIDEHIVVIGTPNASGQIEAKLIRFLPAPFDMNSKPN